MSRVIPGYDEYARLLPYQSILREYADTLKVKSFTFKALKNIYAPFEIVFVGKFSSSSELVSLIHKIASHPMLVGIYFDVKNQLPNIDYSLFLWKARSLRIIDFRSCILTPLMFTSICESLAKNKTLHAIGFSGNGDAINGSIDSLVKALESNGALVHLDLSNTGLKSADAMTVMNGINSNPSSRVMNLKINGNLVQYESSALLWESFGSNSSIKAIWARCSDAALSSISRRLKEGRKLRVIKLDSTKGTIEKGLVEFFDGIIEADEDVLRDIEDISLVLPTLSGNALDAAVHFIESKALDVLSEHCQDFVISRVRDRIFPEKTLNTSLRRTEALKSLAFSIFRAISIDPFSSELLLTSSSPSDMP